MSMASAVSWAVLSQPSVQWTTTDALCFSISSAIRTAPPRTPYIRQEVIQEVTQEVKLNGENKDGIGHRRRRMGKSLEEFHPIYIACTLVAKEIWQCGVACNIILRTINIKQKSSGCNKPDH